MTKESKSSRPKRVSPYYTKVEKVDRNGLTKSQREWYINQARIQCEGTSVEIEDDAKLSVGEDAGAYVSAWVWVSEYDEDKEIPFG